MTKETNVTVTRTFVGKQIDLQKEVFDTLIKDKESLSINVESVGGKDVLFNLGNGVKLSIDKGDFVYVKGDVLVINPERVVISETLKPYKEEVSKQGSGCKFARYE